MLHSTWRFCKNGDVLGWLARRSGPGHFLLLTEYIVLYIAEESEINVTLLPFEPQHAFFFKQEGSSHSLPLILSI
jgi:hypothetical protein